MNDTQQLTIGVVEGFYGVFYTFPERLDLIRFLGRHGGNLYIYAPKNDRQHRARWWEPYPEQVMIQFAVTVTTARAAGVRFCYAISPGGSIQYSSADDFNRLTAKLRGFYEIGVRAFSLMMDDNEPGLRHPADSEQFATLPEAQASLANRVYEWLKRLNPACTLSFVPAEYSGRAPFSDRLKTLGRLLHPDIDLFYTGPETCSARITAEDARAFAQAVGRKPLIWDNYPVNDLSMQPELHLAPLTGRSADLPDETKGFLFNPMVQAEASKIPLRTALAYCADPAGYEPADAWQAGLEEIAGEDYAAPLRLLAQNTNLSCLGRNGQTLERLAVAATSAVVNGELEAQAVRELEAYLTEIDEATYTLKFRLENLPLRANLLPWIEVLEHWMWMTRFSLNVLRAIQQSQPFGEDLNRVNEYREAIRGHAKRIASPALQTLSDYTIQQAHQSQCWLVHQNRFTQFHRMIFRAVSKTNTTTMPASLWRQK